MSDFKNISSNHPLHAYRKCVDHFMPIVYNSSYDVYFFKIETIHPFDTKKWSKIAANLEEYFKIKYPKGSSHDIIDNNNNNNNTLTYCISPSHYITKDELSLVHTRSFICRMHCSPLSVAKASEVCPLVLCPICITERKLLQPIKWQTSGSILAGFLALKYGWAINIGGGFHHCSANSAQGFCLFADITLTIRYLWQEVSDRLNILIVDCDVHQGNGYARDVLSMKPPEQKRIYILDLFNPNIFPGDTIAETAINRVIYLKSKIDDKEYLSLLEFHMEAILTTDHFKPDLIIYNAGTDILIGDPLGRLRISANGITKRDEIVFSFAKQYNISIVMLLSGGYQRSSAQVIAQSIRNLFDKQILDVINN
ncbi:histone deacetylase 11-like [Oppia nitens]|uniref:histone deacetylase 11-like n=1 Tax=Oppia nitens TaxID=1686743 RepID=UPI0023DA70B1|nr:histone deacetylase 11-like [Oppia nitens]